MKKLHQWRGWIERSAVLGFAVQAVAVAVTSWRGDVLPTTNATGWAVCAVALLIGHKVVTTKIAKAEDSQRDGH